MTAQIDFSLPADAADRPTGPVDDIDVLQEEIASLDLRLIAALSRRCEIARRLGAAYPVATDRFDDLCSDAPAFTRALNRLARKVS